MLITRLSKADKKNRRGLPIGFPINNIISRRGRSPSICRIQWPAGIEMRHWNILGDSTEILKGIFEKQERFSKRIVFAKFDRESVASIGNQSLIQLPSSQHTGSGVVSLSAGWYKDCGFDYQWYCVTATESCMHIHNFLDKIWHLHHSKICG